MGLVITLFVVGAILGSGNSPPADHLQIAEIGERVQASRTHPAPAQPRSFPPSASNSRLKLPLRRKRAAILRHACSVISRAWRPRTKSREYGPILVFRLVNARLPDLWRLGAYLGEFDELGPVRFRHAQTERNSC